MALAVYAAICLGLVIFLIGCIRRIVQYASQPMHLRWELYPVPHEEPERVAHGGSYLEDLDWWTKPRHKNMAGELSFMLPEMLFLKGLWEFNRKLWPSSFLFHFGLYILIGTVMLVAVATGLPVLVPSLGHSGALVLLAQIYKVTGLVGSVASALGAVLLLLRRMSDQSLKNYTKPADTFNLLFFIVAFAAVIGGYMTRPAGSAGLAGVATGLFHFNTSLQISTLFGVGLVLAAALVAYIPYTHMAHFIAKYFTYHNVRWDDEPNMRGGKIEAKIAEYLTYRPTWAAAHVGADGKKNWVDIATSNPAQEVRK